MKAMIIFLVFVMQSTAQLLFAQNLTIEVCDIEKVSVTSSTTSRLSVSAQSG